MDEMKNPRRRARIGQGLAVAAIAAGVLGVGCLTRPVAQQEPTTKTNFNAVVKQQAVDKLDILFMIDNSASMGDKQDLLKEAVPDLVSRLLTPDCENIQDPTQKQKPTGTTTLICPDGWQLEFPPVHDMHIGIVTSSLGGGGAQDICEPGGGAQAPPVGNRHDNDRGRLINRTKPASGTTEPPVNNAKPLDNNGGNFLAWLPPGEPKNAGKPDPNVTKEPDVPTFITDFQDLAVGVQEYGCGLEAQLESWYRFLVQPDPYDSIKLDSTVSPAKAFLDGYDATILKQRKDFLRSDSLVAVIMLTDEEDSWSDPLALGGRGWTTRTNKFPGSPFDGTLAKPTSECLQPVDVNNPTTTGPNNPNCTSCGFTGNKADNTPISADPNCQVSCGASCVGYYTPAEDGLNVRYTNDMKRRYGFDPQFPVQRYVDGLRSLKVPNRDGEHPGGGGSYKGAKNCTNPLFAKDLPDGSNLDPKALCELALGQRTPDLIFFAIIGGVPWQLLLDDPNNTASAFKGSLVEADWVKILGKDPATYQQDGIDPHMIESITPRAGLPDPTSSDTADPINSREWNTSLSYVKPDLQYACTFTLPTPKDCNLDQYKGACDCTGSAAAPQGPPVCGNGSPMPRTTQIRGKAYPTIRELRVAKGLGQQGVVASLCPRNVSDKNNPDYGYRPAVRTIIDRLKAVLAGQCLPQPLSPNPDTSVPCLVLISFEQGDQSTVCDASKGLSQVDPDILKRYNESRLADLKSTLPNATLADLGPVCQLAQILPADYINGTCETVSTKAGWCYVEGKAAGNCPQALKFSGPGQPASGSKVSLQCIESRTKADGG